MSENLKMTPAALKILETASHLFYSKGIHSIGVETIAKEAGVTKKTLYDRFGSKDQLIVAYLQGRDQQWRKHIQDYLDQFSEEQPIEQILGIFDAAESWLESSSPRGCAFINALAELTDEAHPGRNIIVEEKRWLKQLFASLLEKLQLSDIEEASEQLFILHEGLMVTHSMKLSSSSNASTKKIVKALLAPAME